jgi:hypothetical protein
MTGPGGNCFYGDYGGIAHVEFRLRRFDGRTFVLVFLYADSRGQQGDIAAILESFRP